MPCDAREGDEQRHRLLRSAAARRSAPGLVGQPAPAVEGRADTLARQTHLLFRAQYGHLFAAPAFPKADSAPQTTADRVGREAAVVGWPLEGPIRLRQRTQS